MNKVKRYLPEKAFELISKSDYKNKEHLYVICDMIYRISIYRKKDVDYNVNTYIDIPKFYFRDIITDSKQISNAFSFLKLNNIIECDNIYSKNSGKSLGYRYSSKILSRLISIDIDKKTISKRIIKNKNKRNNLVSDDLKLYRDYYLSTFSIDYDAAIEYLNNWFNTSTSSLNSLLCGRFLSDEYKKILNKYNYIFMSINAINDGELFFKRNTTNNRIDTNLTSLKGEYKQFIDVGYLLYQLDIINSQPFILSLYLLSLDPSYVGGFFDKKELTKYVDWTSSGLFYEFFEKEYFKQSGKALTRKEIKDVMFCIFYSKNNSYPKEKNIFKSIFPTINNFIEDQKKDKHNEFAIKLQRIESKICIDKISKLLDENGIKYYTIHDAWLVKQEDVNLTKKLIYRSFYKYFNIRPTLKIEKINK